MKKNLEYYIVYGTLGGLEEAMKEWIAKGWEPLGGIALDPEFATFYQAIVKRSKR